MPLHRARSYVNLHNVIFWAKNTKNFRMYPEKHMLSQLLTSQSGSRVALSMCPQSESAYGSNSAPDALITFCMTFRSTSKYMANPDLDHPARIACPPFRFCACPAGDVHQTRIFLRVQNKVGIEWGKDLMHFIRPLVEAGRACLGHAKEWNLVNLALRLSCRCEHLEKPLGPVPSRMLPKATEPFF